MLMSLDNNHRFIIQKGLSAVLRALFRSNTGRLWMLLSAVIVLAAYASGSAQTVTATPSVQRSTVRLADEVSTSPLSGTQYSYIYLPIVSQIPQSPAVYWGALVEGKAPSAENMQPGGIFDAFETRTQKRMSILHWGQPWKMNGSYQAFYAPWFDRQHSQQHDREGRWPDGGGVGIGAGHEYSPYRLLLTGITQCFREAFP
jgi:hypothetical protein